jgi:hypothetical protein
MQRLLAGSVGLGLCMKRGSIAKALMICTYLSLVSTNGRINYKI